MTPPGGHREGLSALQTVSVYGIRKIPRRCRAHQHSPRQTCTDRGALYGLRRGIALRRDGARRSDCAYSGTFGTRTGLRPVRHPALRSGALRCDQAFEYVRHHFNHLVTSFCGPAFRAPLAVAFPAFSPFRRALPGGWGCATTSWQGSAVRFVRDEAGGGWGTKAGRGAARPVDRCCCIARGRRAHARWSMEGTGVRGSSRSSLAGVRCHRGFVPRRSAV